MGFGAMAAALASQRTWLPSSCVGPFRGSFATAPASSPRVLGVPRKFAVESGKWEVLVRNVRAQSSTVTVPARTLSIPQVR